MKSQLTSLLTTLESQENLCIKDINHDDYIAFNELLLIAQGTLNDWVNEPEKDMLQSLMQSNQDSWETLFEWLIARILSDDWNPEWLGWIIYCCQFSFTPWENLSTALQLAACWLNKQIQKMDEDSADKLNKGIIKLNTIIGDHDGTPLLYETLNLLPLFAERSRPQLEALGSDEKTKFKKTITPKLSKEIAQVRNYLTEATTFLQQISQGCTNELLVETSTLLKWMKSSISILNSYIGEEPQQSKSTPASTPEKDVAAPLKKEKKESNVKKQDDESKESDMGLASREDAIEQLTLVYEYFITFEPLSPLPFLLEKALRWSHLTLPELLKTELAEDQGTLERFCSLLGLSDISGTDQSTGNKETKKKS